MNSIRNQDLSRFLDEVSSKSPTPGGGAVAAVVGASAAALVEMVCNLTKDDGLLGVGNKATELRVELLGLADEDCRAFDGVMVAYRTKSKSEIKKALETAIEVPLKTKKVCEEIGELAKVAVEKGNRNALSDAKTAIHLAKAAGESAEENVKINKEAIAKL